MTADKKDFIVTKSKNESVTFTVRMDKTLQAKLDDLSSKSDRSRNELISLCIKYALDNLKFIDD
ncbi:hypothetical protein LY28_01355 [Ruminiclostridium sufflavum DSM 19573]|uniref:Ribbon-helix-helix CopG family protein n=1 Tax=Ruminiclostridium sufflavum DSM 19573 TaxID=1121337 RepID=A0A318XNU7_9FIRM|nr:CopG family transcriptional regulator [Ruminiclostridium sufflavum]PYG88506.1 hypothetical protein LY28_01355 [Ruminiclostridium sufflavum DSM 19573]